MFMIRPQPTGIHSFFGMAPLSWHRYLVVLSSIIALWATLFLIGWAIDAAVLLRSQAPRVPMHALSAVCFMLLAAGIGLFGRETEPTRWRWWCRAACGSVVAIIGSIHGLRGLGEWGLGLMPEFLESRLVPPGIPLNSAVCFLAVGIAVAALDTRIPWIHAWLSELLAVVTAVMATISLVGHSYGVEALYRVSGGVPMDFSTAVLFLLVAVSLLLSRPDRGAIQIVLGPSLGGMMARRLVPFAVVAPCLLGWLRLVGQRYGWYELEIGVAVSVASTIIMFSVVVTWAAWMINRVDQQRREAAAALQSLNETLESRVRCRTQQLARANAELAQKNHELQVFVHSVSHDLRSPLVNLQGFSKELGLTSQNLHRLCLDPAMPEALRAQCIPLLTDDIPLSIQFIQSAVRRVEKIIEALLQFSRVGQLEYQEAEVDLHELLARIREAMQNTIQSRGAELRVEDLPPAWGDAMALEQVFANLLDNALKYLDPDRPGEIRVGSRSPEDASQIPRWHTYFVRDNGIGIPSRQHERIFEAFRRLRANGAPGEGMGLSIVRRIVERHGGRIWVESTEGVGSQILFTLPAVPQEVASLPFREEVAVTW
jgi:signal transduction histidine kinase